MTEVQYLTDRDGKPQAVVLPIDLWHRLLPQEGASFEEMEEAVDDYCLNKAMDEGVQSPLLHRQDALAYLKD